MKLFSCFLISLLGLILTTTPAYARRDADMFKNRQLVGDRPWVPSDGVRGTDMFAKIPLMSNRNADLFGHIKVVPIGTRQDMLHVRRRVMPSSPIFTNDGWTH